MATGYSGQKIGLSSPNSNPVGGTTKVTVDSGNVGRGGMESFIGYAYAASSDDPVPIDFNDVGNVVTVSRSGGDATQIPKYSVSNSPGFQKMTWGSAFSPASLFSSGEQGGYYEPADFSSLFQDTAGTIPVTTVNQQVARVSDLSGRGNHMLQTTPDKRAHLRGTPTGAELTGNPYFYFNTNGWTAGAGWSLVSPAADATAASGTLVSSFVPTVGKTYLVMVDVQAYTSGSCVVSLGGVTSTTLDTAALFFKVFLAATTAPLTITPTAFTGKLLGIRCFDISSNADCKAPYWLDFDGVNDEYSCANKITAYPFTMVSRAITRYPATLPSTFALFQGDVDAKFMEFGAGRTVDWGAEVISAYAPFAFQFDMTLIGEFTSTNNKTGVNLIPGTPTANTNTFGTKTTFRLGSSRTDTFYYKGKMVGGFTIGRTLTAGETANVYNYYKADTSFQAWGDSMTAGSGAGVTAGYPPRLGVVIEKVMENKGTGGETSTQIRARFEADTTNKDAWTNIFWMGTNDPYPAAWPTVIMDNIAACVAGLTGNKRYLVLGITKSVGGTPKEALNQMDALMLATYGNRFVDIRRYLQDRNDGSPSDLADVADGLVPGSLRSDIVHLNDKGYQMTADCLAARISSLGWY